MNDTEMSETMYDEDNLENLIASIKKEVHDSWEKGYQADISVEFKFFRDEE